MIKVFVLLNGDSVGKTIKNVLSLDLEKGYLKLALQTGKIMVFNFDHVKYFEYEN